VDPDRERGLEIAHHLRARSFCVETHEGLSELLIRAEHGVVLMNDEDESSAPASVLDALAGRAGYRPTAFYASSPSPRRIVHTLIAGVEDYFEWPCSAAKLGEV